MRVRWCNPNLSAYAAFVPPVRSRFTAHRDWFLGLRGWHFYATGSLERVVPQRVVMVHLEQAPIPVFLDHRVLGWREAWEAAEAPAQDSEERRGVLFVTDTGRFLAYADTATRSVVASDWVHDARCYDLACRLIQRVCEEMGWHDEYVESQPQPADAIDIELLVGADPEFEVAVRVDERAIVVNANGYIERSVVPTSTIGTDGSGAQLEVRPEPAYTPEELYERIVALANEARARISELARSDVELLLSGHVHPLGCHIHLGTAAGYVAAEYHYFVRELDRMQTPYGELGELMLRLSGSARGSYAVRAACEGDKYHGGFEYRTPPAAILAFPETFCYVAGTVLALAKGEHCPRFPEREFNMLMELVDHGAHFTFGGRTVKCADWVMLAPDHHWSQAWRDVVARVREPARVIRLFGYSAERGEVTNSPRLARAFGWQLIPERYEDDYGIPRSARESNDTELIERIIAEIIA